MPRNLSTLTSIAALAVLGPIVPTSGQAQTRQAVPAVQTGGPNIFGTIALPLKETRFDDRWRRVLHSGVSPGQLTSLVRTARGVPQVEQLRLVNASLNKRIHYRFDTHPSGDYWSTAGETLAGSFGDCEDYVIAKLQALKLLGVPQSDLFMTIGHDGGAGAVHAVLVARAKGQFFVLDNRTDRLIPSDQYRGFYPMITFGSGASWLHGYERGKMPAAVTRLDVALQLNRELPVGSSSGSAASWAPRP